MKDQASKLREMMGVQEVEQQGICVPVAIFSCGDEHGGILAREMTSLINEQENKRTLFINTEGSTNSFKELDKSEEENILLSYTELHVSLDEMHKALKEREERQAFTRAIRLMEKDKEVLFYYCGKTINAKAMNLLALSSIVVLFVNRNVSSVEAALNVIKVQQKIKSNISFLLIGIGMDDALLQEIVRYIQKESASYEKVHVEGIGTFSNKNGSLEDENEVGWKVQFPLIGKSKTLSERLSMME